MTKDEGRRTNGAVDGDTSSVLRPSSVIDCDVHVTWRSVDELSPYLPREWKHRLRAGRGAPRIQPAFYLPYRGYSSGAEAPAKGTPPGSDPEALARDWLDPHDIEYAVLTSYDAPVISTWGDMEYPAAVARAYNEWLIERWLSYDRRFLGSIVVATQDPDAAAAEVERAGAHPQVVQVQLSAGARQGYGQRTFHPIYEAAARHGLHVALHTGTEGLGTSNPPTSAGWPSFGIEWRATQPHNLSAHLVSLVAEGVFNKFPGLKVVLLEAGAAWLTQLLWRLDKNFKAMRSECPWLTELPSVYLKRHVRFGTQRIERPGDPAQLWTLLRMMDAEQLLLFSSNYPRWDMEAPDDAFIFRAAPEAVHARIASENARELYGLTS